VTVPEDPVSELLLALAADVLGAALAALALATVRWVVDTLAGAPAG
jgi:hypothetical protein